MNTEAKVSPKLRLIALLLALFVGFLGAHRFYVGKIFSAICMLVLSVAVYIPAIMYVFHVLNRDSHISYPEVSTIVISVAFSVLTALAVGIWVLIDVIFIASGGFTDKEGLKVDKWVD